MLSLITILSSMRNLLGYLGGINRELWGMELCIDHH